MTHACYTVGDTYIDTCPFCTRDVKVSNTGLPLMSVVYLVTEFRTVHEAVTFGQSRKEERVGVRATNGTL